TAVEVHLHARVEVDLRLVLLERLRLRAEIRELAELARFPAARVRTQAPVPRAVHDRQRLAGRGQGRAVVVQEAIEIVEPDRDGRTRHHSFKDPATGRYAIHCTHFLLAGWVLVSAEATVGALPSVSGVVTR